MSKNLPSTFLVLALWLGTSCVGNRSPLQGVSTAGLMSFQSTDTLKFTSGIRAIFQDSKGHYWFGSTQEGVAVYDGKSFRYFDRRDGLTDNQIHSIQEDHRGVIWFNTQKGVSSFDGTVIINHTIDDWDGAPSDFPYHLVEPAEGGWLQGEHDLWFEAGHKEGLYRYDGQQLHYLAFPPQKALNPYENLFAVTGISKGQDNRIWFATYAGVFGYDGNGFEIINDSTLGFDSDVAPLHIRSILEDSKGRLWIGNNGIGVLLKVGVGVGEVESVGEGEGSGSGPGGSVVNFSEKNHLIHPSSTRRGDHSPPGTLEHVFTIAEDRSGNIWFGDRDAGIWRYDGTHMVNYTTNDGLSSDFATAIYEDKNGTLWFGMVDGSVYHFTGASFEKVL